MQNIERELKLVPEAESLLDELAPADHLGPFTVCGRHREMQRNSFFDSASRALSRAHVGFRRRTIDGQRLAAWTIKGESDLVGGVASRAEIELHLDADMPPALALDTLRAAARSRGAAALANGVDDALTSGGPPLLPPFLETATDRQVLDLEARERGWSVELALDRVRLVGHAYDEVEIEAELKRGDDAALQAVLSAIAALGDVRPSEGSKLSRAMAHLAACDCQPLSAS